MNRWRWRRRRRRRLAIQYDRRMPNMIILYDEDDIKVNSTWWCFLISHLLQHLPQLIIMYSYVFPFLFYSLIPRIRDTVPMKGNVSMVRNYNICEACATDPKPHSIFSVFFFFLHTSFFLLSLSSYFFLCRLSFSFSINLSFCLLLSVVSSTFFIWWIELRYEYGYNNWGGLFWSTTDVHEICIQQHTRLMHTIVSTVPT